jgi:hypothetical protein
MQSQSYEGIYENGVVRFPGPVALPEHTPVTVIAKVETADATPLGCNSDRLYEILSERFDTGDTDAAARVDEHQP